MTLVIITPGPTLSVYRDGKLVIEAPLSTQEALHIMLEIAKEVRP